MICLRCGYCCIAYLVVTPDGLAKVSGVPCPYLSWDRDQAVCKIHDQSFVIAGETYKWEETPCGQFTQIEATKDAPCRMGKFLRDSGKTGKDFLNNS